MSIQPDYESDGSVVRVLLIVSRLGRGGTELQVGRIAQALLARGVEVRALVLFYRDPGYGGLDASRISYLDLPNLKASNLARAVRAAAHQARHWQADLLHGFLSEGNIVACLAGMLARRPAVTSHRDLGIDSSRLLRMGAFLDRHVAAAVTANCRAAAEAAARRAQRPPASVQIIPNIVALAPAQRSRAEVRAELGLAADAPLVIAVGFFRPLKGQEDLLRALAQVAIRVPAIRLLLVGTETVAGYGADLHRLVAQLGLTEVVRFLGERGDVGDLLRASDVFVQPSRSEALSNALLEAQAAGIPAIATDVGGNPEILNNGENGLLVPAHAPDALAAAILDLLEDPARAGRLAEAGQRSVQKRFTPQAAADQLLSLYNGLTHPNHRKPPAVPGD